MDFKEQLNQLLDYATQLHALSNDLSSYAFGDDRNALTIQDMKNWEKLKEKNSELSLTARSYLNLIQSSQKKQWTRYLKAQIDSLKTIEVKLQVQAKNLSNPAQSSFNLTLIPDLIQTLMAELNQVKNGSTDNQSFVSALSYSIWWALAVSRQILTDFKP